MPNTQIASRAGKWRFLSEGFGGRLYWVRHIGHVCLYQCPRTDSPSGKPWHLTCWGSYHATPEEALEFAIKTYFEPENRHDDRTYERQEALMCGLGRFEEP